MKYIDGILCISSSELILNDRNPSGLLSLNNYKNLINRRQVKVIQSKSRRIAYIDFASLPDKYRKKKIAQDGGTLKVEEPGAGCPLIDLLKPDPVAVDFFAKYMIQYEEGEKGLPVEKQAEYGNNVMILNALAGLYAEHRDRRLRNQKKPLSGFWEDAANGVKGLPAEFKHSIPVYPTRLRDKVARYRKEGYASLIKQRFANRFAEKITPEAGEWLLAQWMDRVVKPVSTIERLLKRYNKQALVAGWKRLEDERSIRMFLYRPDIKPKWYGFRQGELVAKEVYTRQNRTILPSCRDALWYSDGTKINLYYRDEKGKRRTSYVYEVIDVYSEALLGYHIGETEDFEMQYHAFKMAVQTAGYKPYELKFDNQGGHKKLVASEFLTKLAAHAINTQAYNGKSKTIESAFGRFQTTIIAERFGYTGQNITAKKDSSKANDELIIANTHKLPTLEELKIIYKECREEWNSELHWKTGVPRMEMYRSSVNEKTIPVTLADQIELFGITTRHPVTYRSNGIEIQVKGKVYAYEVKQPDGTPDHAFRMKNTLKKFYVRYQPDDMRTVALYEKDATGMRFRRLAEEYTLVHRALQEQTHEDLSSIRRNDYTNKEIRAGIVKEGNELLLRHGLHPEQHGFKVPRLRGAESLKNRDIGELQKERSNAMPLEETKVATALQREEERAKQKAADDYYNAISKKRRERLLEELSIN
ncbi:MAG: DDE-type integrase/transposase/recombinase [Bacteroidales bacterium]